MYEDIMRIQRTINQLNENSIDLKKLRSKIDELNDSIRPLYIRETGISKEILYTAQAISERLSKVMDNSWIFRADETQKLLKSLTEPIEQLNVDMKLIRESAQVVSKVFKNYDLLYFPQNEIEEDDIEEKEANTKIVNEIFNPDSEEFTNNKESTIITLSPVNEQVLKYLSENPQALYQLTGTDFEMVMLEIYSKLGYNVEHTQKTRDGGKDIILRKPEILGDFIYYVECKKYAAKRHVGVGIVRNLVGTINTDRVNGGILATTSYFTRDARKFILENNYGYQIQMHDYDIIRRLLDNAIK
jgi:restriction endonuclease Mrr